MSRIATIVTLLLQMLLVTEAVVMLGMVVHISLAEGRELALGYRQG